VPRLPRGERWLSDVAYPPRPAPPGTAHKQLFVDISGLVVFDHKTGIARVVRSVLSGLLQRPPAGYRVEPVYRIDARYYYARRFTANSLGIEEVGIEDGPVEVNCHDVFLGLDADPEITVEAMEFLSHHAQRGLKNFFLVYDLLPLLKPDCFVPGRDRVCERWLDGVSDLADGFVCISQSVTDELNDWLHARRPTRVRRSHVGYFHLGADIRATQLTTGINAHEAQILSSLEGKSIVLMVGTVEPRKGYAQALLAMESLWSQGNEQVMVIVGRHGWMVEDLAQRLRQHPENGTRLFWIENASDELLLKLYGTSTVLLAASEGEGFGLPLVEAAQHGLPVIARDLPVFREIAADHAFYFSANGDVDLTEALSMWFDLFARGEHPASDAIQWQTWEQSIQQLLEVILPQCSPSPDS
jgi:glycosyltransferase involved in cell wall biosynthesis